LGWRGVANLIKASHKSSKKQAFKPVFAGRAKNKKTGKKT